MPQKRHDVPNCIYEPGEIYSFRTSPATDVSLKETGRYGALKVLGVNHGSLYYVVLDGLFDRQPDLAQVSSLAWLRRTRFSYRGEPACGGARLAWETNLQEFSYVLKSRGKISNSCQRADLLVH
jgi:hypothetical protein